MGLYSNILRILDNPENMSQHGRRAYWAHQIVLMAREDAVQRVEALPTEPIDRHAAVWSLDEVIAAIKGEQ